MKLVVALLFCSVAGFLISARADSVKCPANQSIKIDCNVCKCPANGVVEGNDVGCTRMACPDAPCNPGKKWINSDGQHCECDSMKRSICYDEE